MYYIFHKHIYNISLRYDFGIYDRRTVHRPDGTQVLHPQTVDHIRSVYNQPK